MSEGLIFAGVYAACAIGFYGLFVLVDDIFSGSERWWLAAMWPLVLLVGMVVAVIGIFGIAAEEFSERWRSP